MAEWHYCWRCGKSVPMLDEQEWTEVSPLLREQQEQIKEYRHENAALLAEALIAVRTDKAQEKVRDLTGYYEPKAGVIWHHRLAAYGPTCRACGHLLRTERARYCANCGASPPSPNPPGRILSVLTK